MAIALSGGINVWGEFDGSSRSNFIDGLTTFLLLAGWALTASVPASVSNIYSGQPSNGDTVTAGLVYTFVTSLTATANEVLIGSTLIDTLTHLVDAIVHTTGSGTEWSAATPANTIMTATFDGTATVTLLSAFPGPTGNGTPSSYGSLLGGGYKVTGTSPQTDLASTASTLAYIHDNQQVVGSNPLANLVISDAAESLVSNTHFVSTLAGGTTFRVVANRCQFFCYRPTINNYGGGSIFAAGVPYVAPASACSGDVPQLPTDLAFWVSNDFNGFVGDNPTTPRTTINDDGGGYFTRLDQLAQVYASGGENIGTWESSDAGFNSSVTLGDFRLVAMTTPLNYDLTEVGNLVDAMKWHGGNGQLGRRMLLEPLVAWHDPISGATPVRGQLWDAWIGTDTVPMDTVQQFDDGKYYVAFTHNNAWGTLWLQVPTPTPQTFSSLQASYAN